jgi:DNA-binding winged helix-turn-helix (wHTH) protein
MTAPLRFSRAEVRPSERQLLVDGRPVGLGARAFDSLLALVERRDRIATKNELLDCVWPGLVVEENNLQVHISSLHKALGPQAIATIPGRGYRFTAAPDGDAVRQLDAVAPRSTAVPEARPIRSGA